MLRAFAWLSWWVAGTAMAAGVPVATHTVESQAATYTVKASYPKTGVASIDATLKAWVDQQVAAFERTAPADLTGLPGPSQLDISFSVPRNDAAGLAVTMTVWSYTGGAHGLAATTTFNYAMPGATRIDLPQILNGRAGLERISQLAIADLKHQLLPDASDAKWIASGAGPDWDHFTDFVLQPDALVLNFAQYQVAPYASGMQSVKIPLKALAGVLRADPRQPQASFDCTQARDSSERAICGNADLARLDWQLDETYHRRLRTTNDAGLRATLQRTQRMWLVGRAMTCGKATGAAMNACLTRYYQKRLDVLRVDP